MPKKKPPKKVPTAGRTSAGSKKNDTTATCRQTPTTSTQVRRPPGAASLARCGWAGAGAAGAATARPRARPSISGPLPGPDHPPARSVPEPSTSAKYLLAVRSPWAATPSRETLWAPYRGAHRWPCMSGPAPLTAIQSSSTARLARVAPSTPSPRLMCQAVVNCRPVPSRSSASTMPS